MIVALRGWFTGYDTTGRLFRVADFRKLRVWEYGHALSVEVERVLNGMQKASTRDLCDQLSRAAGSIPANIAEGSAHESPHQFARYLQYALGSASELEAHVQKARDINAMSCADFENLMKLIVSERRQLQRFHDVVKDRAGLATKAKMRRTPGGTKRPRDQFR